MSVLPIFELSESSISSNNLISIKIVCFITVQRAVAYVRMDILFSLFTFIMGQVNREVLFAQLSQGKVVITQEIPFSILQSSLRIYTFNIDKLRSTKKETNIYILYKYALEGFPFSNRQFFGALLFRMEAKYIHIV